MYRQLAIQKAIVVRPGWSVGKVRISLRNRRRLLMLGGGQRDPSTNPSNIVLYVHTITHSSGPFADAPLSVLALRETQVLYIGPV